MGKIMKEIKAIEDYIVYLIGKCGLSVTLHPMENDNLITFTNLMQFNTHDNSYCTQVKSNISGYERCLCQQRCVFEKMKADGNAFFGTCHAGVFEYVYPIVNESETVGFISVGGYKSDGREEYIEKTAEKFNYSIDTLRRSYSGLKETDLNKERIDTLIYPLVYMLELAYRKETKTRTSSLISEIIRYVKSSYSRDLKVDEICKIFGCSRSYFSHTFKKKTGKSFREYLIDLRLDSAKRLLTLSSLNVTEIAYSVGFVDSNYFSNLFKKRHGVSPLVYRKTEKK